MEWPSDLALYPPFLRARLKKGFGLGQGETYKPWIRVRDFGSHGDSANPPSIKIDRPYHFLSRPEKCYFYVLERDEDVVDIQEQFPILDLGNTIRLCAKYKVRHIYRNGFPEPFTIDFIVTRRTETGTVTEAHSVKTKEDFDKPRTKARLNIERQWCSEAGIDWARVDPTPFHP